mmetsp:Transcript_52438/g.86982  ORF Transcript_52438/g.86982 Transcript_52438/m.86982 type:complete len:209 (-) Transcript_52438:748-1374(-)
MSIGEASPRDLSFLRRFNLALAASSCSPFFWQLLPAYCRREMRHRSLASSHSEHRSMRESCSRGIHDDMISCFSLSCRDNSRIVSSMSSFSRWNSSCRSLISDCAALYLAQSFLSFLVLPSTSSCSVAYDSSNPNLFSSSSAICLASSLAASCLSSNSAACRSARRFCEIDLSSIFSPPTSSFASSSFSRCLALIISSLWARDSAFTF